MHTHAHSLTHARSHTLASLTHIPIHTDIHIDTLWCYLHMYKYIQNSKNQRERNNNIEIKKCNKVLKVNCLAAASGAAYRIPRRRLPSSWPFLGPQLQLLLSASLCCCCCGLSSALLQRDRVRGRWLGQWLLHCLRVADCGLRFAGYLVNCVLCVVWRHICMRPRSREFSQIVYPWRQARTHVHDSRGARGRHPRRPEVFMAFAWLLSI